MATGSQDKETSARELVLKVSQGDEQAFSELFHLFYPSLYKTTFFITRSEYLAEEVVQDVFLSIWVKRENLSVVENFQAYFSAMARNATYKALKKNMLQETNAGYSEEEPFMDLLDERETQAEKEKIWQVYGSAVEALPEQQRKVFKLSKQSRLSRNQIAEKMGLSPETVKKYLALATLNIRAYCQKNAPELLPALVILLIMQQLPK